MTTPIRFEIPHSLGKDEARRRLAAGISKVASHIPGGGEVQSSWRSADQLVLAITVMGQTISVDLTAEETRVVAQVDIPPMLAIMSGPITDLIKGSAHKSLQGPAKDGDA